ncbi:hypothetical protein HWV62_67 [Athelia sp. TMB]|nr:hypothetical protein HWV62_43186 [Athelia sp. TMB]KAF7986992.1 hypothetical protein HWV62_67 [Athelia sp. TMB]
MPCPGPEASCPCSINYANSIIIPSSPLFTQIDTHYAPTTSEQHHIRANLAEVESDLARLDSALEHLKAAQERLQLKRSALQQHAAACAALMAPIKRVPPEILVEVFMYLLPKVWNDASAVALRSRMLPSHICKRWRELSLSVAHFWSEITVKVDREDMDRRLECARSWLARSGSCPLKVHLSCLWPPYLAQWQSLLDLILPYSTRWAHASIHSVMPDTLTVLKGNLPILESVAVIFSAWPNSYAPFESAPKLRRIDALADDLLNGAALPWAQLTEVEVSDSSVRQCLAIINKLPNVVSYNVTLSSSSEDPVAELYGGPPIRLVNLKHLNVTGEADISGFHESLELPALISYTYQEAEESVTLWKMTALSSLIARSSCLVKDIDILLTSAVGEDDAVLLLQHTPSLETLDLRSRCARGATCSSILQALSIHLEASCLAPQLQELCLYYDQDFDFQLIVEMLELRLRLEGDTPLVVVEVHDAEDITLFDAGLLRRLREGPGDSTIMFMDKNARRIKYWDLQTD